MADSYVQLIDWEEFVLSEPPLTLPKTDAEVSAFRDVAFEVPKYPCHTQAVERAIRLVSEASTAVVGQEARNGYIKGSQHEKSFLNLKQKRSTIPVIVMIII